MERGETGELVSGTVSGYLWHQQPHRFDVDTPNRFMATHSEDSKNENKVKKNVWTILIRTCSLQ